MYSVQTLHSYSSMLLSQTPCRLGARHVHRRSSLFVLSISKSGENGTTPDHHAMLRVLCRCAEANTAALQLWHLQHIRCCFCCTSFQTEPWQTLLQVGFSNCNLALWCLGLLELTLLCFWIWYAAVSDEWIMKAMTGYLEQMHSVAEIWRGWSCAET